MTWLANIGDLCARRNTERLANSCQLVFCSFNPSNMFIILYGPWLKKTSRNGWSPCSHELRSPEGSGASEYAKVACYKLSCLSMDQGSGPDQRCMDLSLPFISFMSRSHIMGPEHGRGPTQNHHPQLVGLSYWVSHVAAFRRNLGESQGFQHIPS